MLGPVPLPNLDEALLGLLMGDESLVAQMEKLQVGEARVGDVVRLADDAFKSPIKRRDKDMFVRAVSKNGNTALPVLFLG
eukprot:SAG22_NODE_3728_length_1557_cov_1.725652_2_plen_80_part_00